MQIPEKKKKRKRRKRAFFEAPGRVNSHRENDTRRAWLSPYRKGGPAGRREDRTDEKGFSEGVFPGPLEFSLDPTPHRTKGKKGERGGGKGGEAAYTRLRGWHICLLAVKSLWAKKEGGKGDKTALALLKNSDLGRSQCSGRPFQRSERRGEEERGRKRRSGIAASLTYLSVRLNREGHPWFSFNTILKH